MKREIKFRSWLNDEQCYSEEPFWRILLCKDGKIYNSENDTYYNFDERYTIEQFTGLKDKNGVEIYEGDILQTETGIASVIWSDAAFALLSPGSEATDWEHSSVYEKSEVIGNIHEHPELLK